MAQPLNTISSRTVIPFGIFAEESEVQESNACLPKYVTLSGIVIASSLEHP